MLVTIDPGVSTGWSLWDGLRLAACGLGDPRPSLEGLVIDRVVIEHPVIYPRQRTRDPNAIVKLAVDAGRWAGRFERFGTRIDYVEPARWKGQVPKEVHHPRVWGALSAAEQGVVGEAGRGIAPSKRHNMLDAIGLGLFALGRLGPGR